MSSIVTFYSYKGGVGRSMALANIAFELARRNKKVLIVDWDLEAPGLERYFNKFEINKNSEGLLQLLLKFRNNDEADYNNYLWTITAPQLPRPISLLHSGRDKDPVKYSSDLERFNWDEFFLPEGGGQRLEQLRNMWLKDFDLVLIDSRTGLSDASGVCTIMLPDVVIPMFTANYQSLFGIRDIMNFIQSARQKLAIDRMALTILPVPSRFGTRVEFRESQEWLDRIADILKDCFSDWLPRWIEPRYVLEQIKIPQVDFFSFGEKLAVVEQGTNDPEGMGFIYAKLADFLASDFMDIENFVGRQYYNDRKAIFNKQKQEVKDQQKEDEKYKYDLFISYPRPVYQWVRETLLLALTEYLNDDLGYPPKIFIDASEISIGSNWNETYKKALEKSKVFLFVFGDDDSKNDFGSNELLIAETIQKTVATNIIFPILFKKQPDNSSLPLAVQDRQVADFSAFSTEAINSSTKINAQFGSLVGKLSSAIANSIRNVDFPDQHLHNQEYLTQLGINSLAHAYESLRSQLPSGSSRTRAMQDIVNKMKEKASQATFLLRDLMKSASPGKRLAAIAIMHEHPNIEYVDWLANHVGGAETPFVGFQASVALYIAARTLADKTKVNEAIDIALTNIDKSEYKDPNQIDSLLHAKNALNLRN